MRLLQGREVDELTFLVGTLVANLWQFHHDEHHCHGNQHKRQNEIGQLHGICLCLDKAFPSTGIVGRNRLTRKIIAAQHQLTQKHS